MNVSDIQLALMAGIDIPIPEFQLVCHSPTVKDIAYMGESQFFNAMQYLCISKEMLPQDETVLQILSNFQILMKVLKESDKSKKASLTTLLTLLFPNYQIVIMPQSINFITDASTVMVDNENFDTFQNIMREVLCVHSLFQGENVVYKPANAAAKRIADKIYKGRQKLAELKSKENGNGSVLVRYLSILTIGAKTPLKECVEYNLFQLFDQIERYTAFVEWDTDLQVRLAGGKPDKQVESWMRDLHSKK